MRHTLDTVALVMALLLQWRATRAALHAGWRREIVWPVSAFVCAALAYGYLARMSSLDPFLPSSSALDWVGGLAFVYALILGLWTVFDLALSPLPIDPCRRQAIAALAPAAVCGYGVFIERNSLSVKEADVEIPGLPADLDGLRVVQLSDIHFGSYFGRRELERAIDMANETRAQIALVTGDLISTARDPLDDCLQLLARLRADAGVYGCMGNHERYSGCEAYVGEAGLRQGARYLRQEAEVLRFGAAQLNLAGVDYQRSRRRYLQGADALLRPEMPNILLSHNPSVFPTAVQQGWDAVISGHTHGGQVRVEIIGEDVSPARYYTRYTRGVYRQGRASVHVSCGLGTIGAPIRLGAPPEVNLIRLCATSS